MLRHMNAQDDWFGVHKSYDTLHALSGQIYKSVLHQFNEKIDYRFDCKYNPINWLDIWKIDYICL